MASSAKTKRPVRIISLAMVWPTSAGNERGALHSLMKPAGTAISAKRTLSEQMRRSHEIAISMPMPTAMPSTAAMVTWGKSSSLRHMRWATMWKWSLANHTSISPYSPPRPCSSLKLSSWSSLGMVSTCRSPPPQKLPPAPVMMTTRTGE